MKNVYRFVALFSSVNQVVHTYSLQFRNTPYTKGTELLH